MAGTLFEFSIKNTTGYAATIQDHNSGKHEQGVTMDAQDWSGDDYQPVTQLSGKTIEANQTKSFYLNARELSSFCWFSFDLEFTNYRKDRLFITVQLKNDKNNSEMKSSDTVFSINDDARMIYIDSGYTVTRKIASFGVDITIDVLKDKGIIPKEIDVTIDVNSKVYELIISKNK